MGEKKNRQTVPKNVLHVLDYNFVGDQNFGFMMLVSLKSPRSNQRSEKYYQIRTFHDAGGSINTNSQF